LYQQSVKQVNRLPQVVFRVSEKARWVKHDRPVLCSSAHVPDPEIAVHKRWRYIVCKQLDDSLLVRYFSTEIF
jgi:hypothetical protein